MGLTRFTLRPGCVSTRRRRRRTHVNAPPFILIRCIIASNAPGSLCPIAGHASRGGRALVRSLHRYCGRSSPSFITASDWGRPCRRVVILSSLIIGHRRKRRCRPHDDRAVRLHARREGAGSHTPPPPTRRQPCPLSPSWRGVGRRRQRTQQRSGPYDLAERYAHALSLPSRDPRRRWEECSLGR